MHETCLDVMGLGVRSTASSDITFARTTFEIPWDDLPSIDSVEVELNGSNQDSTGREIRIIDLSGPTQVAAVTIPASTGDTTNLKTISAAWASPPSSGTKQYAVQVEGSAANDQVYCHSLRIRIVQTGAPSSTVAWFPLVADRASSRTENIATDSHNNTAYAQSLASNFCHYLHQASLLSGSAVTARLCATARKLSTFTTHFQTVALHNLTSGNTVTASEVSNGSGSADTTWKHVVSGDISGDSEWVDGEEYDCRHKTNNAFSATWVATAWIRFTISDPAAVRTWFRIQHDISGTVISDHWERTKYVASRYDGPSPALAGTGKENVVGDVHGVVEDHGTNAGPGSSSPTKQGQVDFTGTKAYAEGTSGTLTDGNYYGGGSDRTDSSTIDLTALFLVVDNVISAADFQRAASEAFGLSDSARMVVYSVKRLSASEALGVGEPGKQAADFGFTALPAVSEAFGLSDEPQAPAGQPYLSASEALGIVDEPGIPFSGPAYSARTLTIAEISLSQGDRYIASKGVRHPDRFYRGIVKQWGSVVRSFPMPTGIPQIGEAVVEVVDDDGELRRLFGESDPRNSTVVLKDGPEGGSYALFQTIYTGDISGVEFLPGMQRISLLDKSWRWLDEQIPKLLVRRIFDDALLGRNVREKREGAYREEEVFSPIVIGIVPAGSVNAVRLSDTRFNLCRHPVPHSQIALLGRGPDDEDFTSVSATITEEVKLIDGIQYRLTHADFSTAQDERFELRWGGHGMTDTGLNTGAVIETPAEGFEAFLLRIAGRTADQINDAAFKTAAAYMAAIDTGGPVAGLYVAGSITEALTYGEAATRYLRSFGLVMYLDKQGRISIRMVTDQPETLTDLDDLQDILEKSESHRLANPVYSKIDYQFARNNASGEWIETGTESNANALTQLKRPSEFTLPLWFVADPFTATWVVLDLVQWTDPTAKRIKKSVPGHRRMPQLELAQWVSVTNWSGPGSGYSQQPFLLTGIRYDVDGRRLELEAITRLQPQAGQGAVKGNPSLDARVGPHYFAHGKFFAVLKDRNDETILNVMASVDWGQNFTIANATGAPVFGSGNRILAHDSVTDRALATRILIVTQTLDGVVELHAFDMSLQQWEFVNRVVWASVSGFENIEFGNSEPQFMAQVERSRGAKARIGVFFFRESDPNLSGQFGGLRGRTAWAYSDDDGLTWSTPVDIGKDVDLQSRYGELYSYHGGRIYAGDGDRFHFFYTRLPGDLTRNTPDAFHRTALDSGSLSAETQWILTDLSTFTVPSPYHYGVAALQYEENEEGELEPWLYVPFNGALNGNWIRVQSGDGLESGPTWKGNHFTAGNVILVDAGDGNTNAPQMTMQSVRGTIHFMGAHHLGLTFKSYSFHNITGNSQADRIGPHYNVLLGPQHAGFLILDLAGRLWIATLQTSRTVDYEFYFTFWPLSDLPRDAAFDTTAIEALITAPE